MLSNGGEGELFMSKDMSNDGMVKRIILWYEWNKKALTRFVTLTLINPCRIYYRYPKGRRAFLAVYL